MGISNIKIVTRIVLSILIILVFSIITIGFLIYELKGIESKARDIYSIYIISNSSSEIQKTLSLLKNNINDNIAAVEQRDMLKVSTFTLAFSSSYNTIDVNLKILKDWVKDKKDRDLVINAENAFSMLATVESDINEFYAKDDIESIKNILNELDENLSLFNISFQEMNHKVRMSADNTYNLIQSYIIKDIIIFLSTAAVLLIVSVLIIIFIAKNISKSFSFFKNIFEKGASGNLNARYPVNTKAKDELTVLGKFYNTFIDEVGDVIREVVDASNDLGASSEEVSATINNFAENSQSQAASSEEITATMEEISGGVDNISDNSQFQYNELKDFIVKMDELSKMISSMSSRITEAEELSKTVSERASAGNKSLSLMDKLMNNISESSNKVSDIISIINNISDQINLLSLNAAIEAARAGEAGRGFAVVADEISKLAEQTASSIGDIDLLINENRNEIANAMSSVFETVDNIGRVIEGVESINQMMSDIYSDMAKQNSANESVNKSAEDLRVRSEEIKNATEEQKTAISEIMKSITNINGLIQSSASGAEEMTANSNKLASMAESMRNRIAFFEI